MITLSDIQRIIDPVKRRILGIFARAVVEESDDTTPIQTLQLSVMEDEVRDGVERFQDYGFTSNPPDDAEVIVGFIAGNRSQGIALKVDDPATRLKNLEKGEVAMYTADGSYLKAATGKELHGKFDKIKFENDTDELMDLLISVATECRDAMDKLSTDTTNTLLGPMQLNGFAYYALRKTALDSLITKLTNMKAS